MSIEVTNVIQSLFRRAYIEKKPTRKREIVRVLPTPTMSYRISCTEANDTLALSLISISWSASRHTHRKYIVLRRDGEIFGSRFVAKIISQAQWSALPSTTIEEKKRELHLLSVRQFVAMKLDIQRLISRSSLLLPNFFSYVFYSRLGSRCIQLHINGSWHVVTPHV